MSLFVQKLHANFSFWTMFKKIQGFLWHQLQIFGDFSVPRWTSSHGLCMFGWRSHQGKRAKVRTGGRVLVGFLMLSSLEFVKKDA